MIRFLSNDQIDYKRWDETISQATNGIIYSYSWFLDLVCPGWCALVEDEYLKIMPIPVWQKFKVHYLAQPRFTQQLGVFSKLPVSTRDVKDFLYKIPHRFKYVDINLNSSNKIESTGLNYKYNINYELYLGEPYERLHNAYTDHLRRNIRKSSKFPFVLDRNIRPELLIELFRKNRGSKIKTLTDPEYHLLLKLLNVLIQKGLCEVWGIHDEHDQLAGGIAWVTSHHRDIFLFSAVSETGRQKGAMPLLIDTFIRENAGKDRILDFEGSNNEKLGRFYAGFGSKKLFYPRIYFNHLPFYGKIGMQVYRYFKTILKK